MPLYISKPQCLDCDLEYFLNVSGYHPCRELHDPYSGVEPVRTHAHTHTHTHAYTLHNGKAVFIIVEAII